MSNLITDIKSIKEETIFGSDGKDLKPCFVQKASKSLKSDLYALKVLFDLELLRLFKVASCKDFTSVIRSFI